MSWRWPWRRPARMDGLNWAAHSSRSREVWPDLTRPDAVIAQAAELAALKRVLNEPTMIFEREVRVPPFVVAYPTTSTGYAGSGIETEEGRIGAMTATATVDAKIDEDSFDLDVRVIEDERPADVRACATDNGCPPTCASSCTSAA